MRNRFDEQLSQLHTELIAMGDLCKAAISAGVGYLLGREANPFDEVNELEKQIDQKEREIEALCMKLLLHQQPVAGDLRTVSSALKMISDMERIGDQAADIAEIVTDVEEGELKGKTHIARMARATMNMVTDSVESFVKRDLQLARNVLLEDDAVDALFDKVKQEWIEAVKGYHSNPEALVDLLMVAKYLERIGDHAENIAEWVIYSITGEHV